MGEFDLGEEQAGEGGEGFMDLGAAIGNKVGQHDQPTFAGLPHRQECSRTVQASPLNVMTT